MPGLKLLCERRGSKNQETRTPPRTPPLEPAQAPPKLWRPSEDDADHVQPTMACLFTDAAAYRKVIADSVSRQWSRSSTLGKVKETTFDFAELVGHDLDAPEKAEAGKFAQIAAADWTSVDDSDSHLRLTEEPEPLTDSDSISTSSTSDSSEHARTSPTPPTSEESVESTDSTAALTPEQVVHLLEQEFGALAPEGEEKLVFQTDGAVIEDVVILVRIVPRTSTR